jgi:hypothetical protein
LKGVDHFLEEYGNVHVISPLGGCFGPSGVDPIDKPLFDGEFSAGHGVGTCNEIAGPIAPGCPWDQFVRKNPIEPTSSIVKLFVTLDLYPYSLK